MNVTKFFTKTPVIARGNSKEDFLKNMTELWDCMDPGKNTSITGFWYRVGECIIIEEAVVVTTKKELNEEKEV